MNKKIQINFFCKSNQWSRRMIRIREIAQKIIKIDDLNDLLKGMFQSTL